MASLAHASPFVNVTIEGYDQTLGQTSANYASSLSGVSSGDTIVYEVIEEISQTVVSNTNHTPSYMLVEPQTSGTDGINTTQFGLSDSSGLITSLTAGTLVNGWNGLTGYSGGTVSGTEVTGIKGAQAGGTYVGATAASQVLTGSFVAGSAASDTFGLLAGSDGGGGFKVDTTAGDGKPVNATAAVESGSDPYYGYTALNLSETQASPVPAPGTFAGFVALLAGMGLVGLIKRGRQLA
jgi:hypothetical protein